MDRKKIPISKEHYINTKGEVFEQSGERRKTYRNGDNYESVSIRLLDGRMVTCGVHMLVALTFIPNDNPERREVNHRIPNLYNNHVSNLEWVTPLENNIHSEIFRRDNKFTSIYSSKDGIPLKLYNNVYSAYEDTGIDVLQIWDSIKDKKTINGIQFFHKKAKGRIPEGLAYNRRKNFTTGNRQPPKPVKMMDIDTGEILFFKSILAASKHFETNPSHIYQCITEHGCPRAFRKKYQVTYTDRDFPIITIEELNLIKNRGPKPVIAYNFENKKYYKFKQATDYIRFTKLSKKSVTSNLKKNRIKRLDNWIVLYYNKENFKRIISYVNCPEST